MSENPSKKNICLVSGGKDSQAVAIYCMKNKIVCDFIFSDTGWEDQDTYKFLKDFEKKLPKKITYLIPELQFEDLAKKKKRFPSTKAKFCTVELKIHPFIDHLLKQRGNFVILQGIRWQESTNREGMNKTDDYFRYYFEPYGFDKEGKPKYYTYRKNDIIKWLVENDAEIVRPIISWSEQEVFNFIIDNGFMPNKLYQYGFTRVGCFPCINVYLK